MKVQCACGAKYALDVTPRDGAEPGATHLPELRRGPFAIRQRVDPAGTATSRAAGTLKTAPPANPLRRPIETNRPRMRIQGAPTETAAAAAPAEPPADEQWPMCLKHPHQRTTHQCVMCNKPICPDCMALFGYVCSPLCRAKATANGIHVPVFKGERAYIEGRRSRLVGLVGIVIAVVILGLIGLWGWYAFFGSQPHRYFSVMFTERATSGESAICADNQIVFLHGGTLARYDMKHNKEIWSHDLTPSDLRAARYLHLCVYGRNVWVAAPEKLTRYDWDDGEAKQDISLAGGDVLLQTNEVQVLDTTPGSCSVTHISLADGMEAARRKSRSRWPAANGGRPWRSRPARARRSSPVSSRTQQGCGLHASKVNPSQIADSVQIHVHARAHGPARYSRQCLGGGAAGKCDEGRQRHAQPCPGGTDADG